MEHSLTTISGLERRLEIAVPVDQVAAETEQRLKRLMRTVRIKGFRVGKVPYAVVRSQYGEQAHMEAVEQLMQTSVAESLGKLQLRPAAAPRIEPINFAPDSELRFAALFEVLPEIRLQPLASLQYAQPTAVVTDADIDNMIERMRKQRPVHGPVQRPAKAGDSVSIDFEGRIDGTVFPGGKGEGMKVVLGAGTILPELDAALHGMSVGESGTIPARFPDDYGAPYVAGKQAEFDIKVTAVEEPSLPALDEAFVRSLGLAEGGVAELRAEVRKGMERELADQVRNQSRESALDALYKAHPLDLPKVLIDEQVQELQAQMQRRMGAQASQTPGRELFEEPARKRVALGLIIGELVRANELKPDRQQVEARLAAAVQGSRDPEQLRRQYVQSREAMQQLEAGALEDAAISFVLSQAKAIEKPSNFSELAGYDPASGSGA
jgi:trigger factor